MNTNSPQIIFTGILNSYLVLSSIAISFWLVISETTMQKFIIFASILVAHCFLMYRYESLAGLKDFYMYLQKPQAYELPQRIYDSRIKASNPYYRSTVFDPTKRQSRLPTEPVDCFRQDNRFSKQQHKRYDRDSGLPFTNIKDMKFGGNSDNSMLDSKNIIFSRNNISGASYGKKKKLESNLDISAFRQEQINALLTKCNETLETQKINKEQYWSGIERTKNMLSYIVESIVQRHYRNLKQLNFVIKQNFDKSLKEQDSEARTQGKISLDEIIQESYRDSSFSNWKLNTNFTKFFDKASLIERLRKLIDERLFVDKHLLMNKSSNNLNREQALARLNKISHDASKIDFSFESIRNNTNRQDELALFRLFEASINLNLPPQCQNLKIRSHYAYAFRTQQAKQLAFCFTQLTQGNVHINFISGKTVYNCQPGDNNVFSAIYFYLREVKNIFSKQFKSCKVISNMISEVFN